jgi:integrase
VGEITDPCGVPVFISDHLPSSITPAFNHFWISRTIRGSATRWSTKTKKPLKVRLEGGLAALIAKRRELRAVEHANGSEISAVVLHREGLPIIQSIYRHPWEVASMLAGEGEITCRKCGTRVESTSHCGRVTAYCGRLIHDLRRTAARDLLRSGTPHSVAMKITGHATNSMFIRYNITDTDDIREALRSMRKYRSAGE